MRMSSVFDRQKNTCLSGVDLSRKGSVDAPIQQLVEFINKQNDFFTTSSCSGRIMVVDNDVDGVVKKQGCKWIFTSHDYVTPEDLISSGEKVEGNCVFKFEPFVLHVQCRSLEHAQSVLSAAVSSGFRNSGISVGNKGKFITAVRSTHSLEVPLSSDGRLLVSSEYLTFLVQQANSKMRENLNRINRLFETLQSTLLPENQERRRKGKGERKHRLDNSGKTDSSDHSRQAVSGLDSQDNNSTATVETRHRIAECETDNPEDVVFDCSLFDGDG